MTVSPGRTAHAPAASRTLRLLFAAVGILASARPAAGQTHPPAVVRVQVADIAGTPIPRAELAILGLHDSSAVAAASTDSAGRHTFVLTLDSTRYRITARKLGFLATIRLLVLRPGDTVSLELRMATVAAVQLPAVVTRGTYRLDLDPGTRDGFAQRCASPIVACVGDSTLASRPSADLLSFLNRANGVIAQPDNGYAPPPPKMYGTFTGTCEPAYYVNGFRWGLRWQDLASSYLGFAIEGIEVYRAGQPRPARFGGDPDCGVIVIWTK
jgi:hypothetical protein